MDHLPNYDADRTYAGECEPDSLVDCDECEALTDAETTPLRGKVLCVGCAASLAFGVLESETEGRIAKVDAIARLRAFCDFHESKLRLSPVLSEARRIVAMQAEMYGRGGK